MSSREDLEKQREMNRTIAGDGIKSNISEINKLETGIRNTAFTLATFVFTFSSPIVVDLKDLELNEIQKVILYTSWIFLFMSICFGLIQVYLNVRFHRKMLDQFIKRDNIWANLLPQEDYEKEFSRRYKKSTILYNAERPSGSSEFPTILQIVFLIIGFITILVVAISLLFR